MVEFTYAVTQLDRKLSRVGKRPGADEEFDAMLSLVGMAMEEDLNAIFRAMVNNFAVAEQNKAMKWTDVVRPIISLTGKTIKEYNDALSGLMGRGSALDTHVHQLPSLLTVLVKRMQEFVASMTRPSIPKGVVANFVRVLETAEPLLGVYAQTGNALRALKNLESEARAYVSAR